MTTIWVLLSFWLGGLCGFALFAVLNVSHEVDARRHSRHDALAPRNRTLAHPLRRQA